MVSCRLGKNPNFLQCVLGLDPLIGIVTVMPICVILLVILLVACRGNQWPVRHIFTSIVWPTRRQSHIYTIMFVWKLGLEKMLVIKEKTLIAALTKDDRRFLLFRKSHWVINQLEYDETNKFDNTPIRTFWKQGTTICDCEQDHIGSTSDYPPIGIFFGIFLGRCKRIANLPGEKL